MTNILLIKVEKYYDYNNNEDDDNKTKQNTILRDDE